MLKNLSLLPIDYKENDFINKPIDMFIGYLMFDCLISNPDRHHENWGFIVDNINNKNSISLAPTYDHASGFGCRISDEEIARRIATKDKRYTIKAFVKRARSAFIGKDMNRVSTIEAFSIAAKQNPKASSYWLAKLEKISLRQVINIFNKVPSTLISEYAMKFAIEILDANRTRLLNIRRETDNG